MSYAVPGPCPGGHQELKLMKEITSLTDTERQMMCNLCCHAMSFEDAVRNDERMKIGRLDAELAAVNVYYVEPGGVLIIGGFSSDPSLVLQEKLVAMVNDLRKRCGISMIYAFADEIGVQFLAPETIAAELLAAAERDPRVAEVLGEFIAKRNRINDGGLSDVMS